MTATTGACLRPAKPSTTPVPLLAQKVKSVRSDDMTCAATAPEAAKRQLGACGLADKEEEGPTY